MASSNRTTSQTVTSQAALSRALADVGVKINQPSLSKRIARGDLPAAGPWNVGEVAARLKYLRGDDEDAAINALSKNPERIARIKLIVERTAKIKLERELLAGGYVKREDADKAAVASVYSVRAKLQELPLRASLIAGKSEAECERIIGDWVREIGDFYAGGGHS